MANMKVSEDPESGRLILRPWKGYKRLGYKTGIILGLVAMPLLACSGSIPIIIICSVATMVSAVCLFFSFGTVTIDPERRVLNKTREFIIRYHGFSTSIALPFTRIAAIKVEYWPLRSRGWWTDRVYLEAWRLLAIDRAGRQVELDGEGKLDEMIELGKKIAALTGAPLLDRMYSSGLDQQPGG